MEFELRPVQHSADEQHRSDESNVISTSVNQQNSSYGQKRWKKPTIAYNAAKLRYSFFLTIDTINLIFIYD
jgi:hypothetical protein